MSLWHDKNGAVARGISAPGIILARHIKWYPSHAEDTTTPTWGPCPDEINVALASLKPLMMPNGLHTFWCKTTTGSWWRHPNVEIWLTFQSVPDIAVWANETKDLDWLARWMNPKTHAPREYVPVTAGQTDLQYAKDLTDRWRGITV